MNHGKRGFTLIELLITIAILTAVSVAGFIGLSKYKGGQNVDLSMEELTSVIRDVQKRSITEQDGKQWGIRFSNASSSYEIWSGTSYASGTVDRLYSLGRNVYFGNPSTSTLDTIFSVISGKLSEARVISLVNPRKDGIVGDIILTERGTVTNRLEHGLVGYWHFDEATSTVAYDSSGLANTSTLTNGPTWQIGSSCEAGECLSFNGSTNYVNVGDPTGDKFDFGTSDFTFEAWIKPTALNSFNTVFTKQPTTRSGGPHVTINSSGNVQFDFDVCADSITLSTPFTTGSWQHFVLIRDYGTAMYVYRNGVLVGTYTTMSCVNRNMSNNQDFRIASTGQPYAGYFSGSIDEVRVYNRALSAAEILDLYNDLK